jgi:hypothetical protein
MEVGQVQAGMPVPSTLPTRYPLHRSLNAVIDSMIRYAFETGSLTWYEEYSCGTSSQTNRLYSAGTIVTMLCVCIDLLAYGCDA